MGSRPSKQETAVKFSMVGSNLNFSDDVLKRLAQSNETDFSRNEEAERLLEKEVNKRLIQLEKETLKNFEEHLKTSLILSEIEPEPLTSGSLDNKIQKLEEKLKKLQSTQQDVLDDNGKKIREELLNCLIDNKGKPLNCYDYIQQFNKVVNQS
ncbi:Mic19p PWA37_003426 [Arxiozyma heterogenica]|uniref:Mic19p n=1 Tax=Arxiozyma heterogenica TaxID=278026 RepID=UPI002F139B65